MFVITGRILTILNTSDLACQVVLSKTIRGKKTAIAIDAFGRWKEHIQSMNLCKGDKIKGMVYLKSNFYKKKWYTDLYFREIEKVEVKTKKPNDGFKFNDDDIIGDVKHFYDENGNILL
jgi:hypothetical protein